MIFDGKFADFQDFSLNFCQQVDFLPQGGRPRIFVKYSPVQCAMRPGHVENWKNLILYSIIVIFQILLFNSVGLFKF